MVEAASLVATSVGAGSSAGSSSVKVLVEAGRESPGIVTPVRYSRDPSCEAGPSTMASSENYMYDSIAFLSSRMHLAKRCVWSGIGWLAFFAQYCRACMQSMVFWDCPSLIFWQGNMGSGGSRNAFCWKHLGPRSAR